MTQRIPTTDELIARAKTAIALGAYEDALCDAEEALRAVPGYADLHHLRGRCLAGLDRVAEAIRAFDRAIEINPGYIEAHVSLAVALRDAGRHTEAQESFSRSAEAAAADDDDGRYRPLLSARFANLHRDLGDAYAESGFLMEAAEQYRRACAIRPGFADIRNRLARTLIDLGLLEAAIREARSALEINPAYVEARANLGLALFHAGRIEEARTEWAACQLHDSSDAQLTAQLAFLEEPVANGAGRNGSEDSVVGNGHKDNGAPNSLPVRPQLRVG